MVALRWAAAAVLLVVSRAVLEDDSESCGCAASRSDSAPVTTDPVASVGIMDPISDSPDSVSVDPAGSTSFGAFNFDDAARSRVPAGTNSLGTDTPYFKQDGEGPAYDVTFTADFWVDTYEVTNRRFSEFVRATGFKTDAESYGWSFVHELAVPKDTLETITSAVKDLEWWLPVNNATWAAPEGPGTSLTGRWDHPAIHISQIDAAAFCKWAGGRLPTEEEWEYAARGGKAGRAYPWGNALMTGSTGALRHRANIWQGVFPWNNTGEDGYLWTSPVNAFGPQNALGLHNVVGNVWEWTADTWCPPRGSEQKDGRRLGQECKGRHRKPDPTKFGDVDVAKRGGSFLCHRDSCFRYRTAARHYNSRDTSAYNIGARCVYDSDRDSS